MQPKICQVINNQLSKDILEERKYIDDDIYEPLLELLKSMKAKQENSSEMRMETNSFCQNLGFESSLFKTIATLISPIETFPFCIYTEANFHGNYINELQQEERFHS